MQNQSFEAVLKSLLLGDHCVLSRPWPTAKGCAFWMEGMPYSLSLSITAKLAVTGVCKLVYVKDFLLST